MKKINSIKIIYILSALLFCISLQSTATTQPKIETTQPKIEVLPHYHDTQVEQNNQTEQNVHNAFNLNLMRKHNNKPHNTNNYYNSPGASLNNAGKFDSNFGTKNSGYVINTMGFNSAAKAVVIRDNNKIVVAGIRENYPLLAQYNNNGSLDAEFGINNYGPGVVIQTNLDRISSFNAVAIDPLYQTTIAVGHSQNKAILVSYYDNGSLNTFFGTNGIIKTNIDGELNAVAVQKDNKIVVAGYNIYNAFSDTQMILMRYDEYGVLDDNFGTRGIAHSIARARANAITIQENNKIVVVGTFKLENQNDVMVARYNTNGTLDQSFGHLGIAALQIGKNHSIAYDVIVQKDQKIVVVGSSISQQDRTLFTIIRLNQDGSKDASFGNNGIITITPTLYRDDNAYAQSVTLDENENIIVMGYTMVMANTIEYNYFSLLRFSPDGILDGAFAQQGIESSPLKSNNALNRSSHPVIGTMQDNHKKIVLAGNFSTSSPTASNQFAVARYHN